MVRFSIDSSLRSKGFADLSQYGKCEIKAAALELLVES